jgi:2-dehydro-3-deoxyphosphooctonate aldolase (KDO 8-P synthase)
MIFIFGPCVIESEDHAVRMAAQIHKICFRAGIGNGPDSSHHWVFKASFDKANRMSIDSFRGPGLGRGLEILQTVREETGARVTSDIHEPGQAGPAAEVLDIIQIPAMLCRQTDLIVAAARTGKPINIKKSQSAAPDDMRFVIEKIRRNGHEHQPVFLTERGTAFGYRDLVVDMRSIPAMKSLGVPVIIDAGHSVQKPGGGAGCSGGQPMFIPTIARAAVAAGADGVFVEVHDDPANAKSDGPNSLPLAELPAFIQSILRVREAICE